MKEVLCRGQVEGYLHRLGIFERPEPCTEALDYLVFLHQKTIPFETYTVNVLGEVPSLALECLYRKIVAQRKGGYCFELNKLFEALLAGLGFEARPVLCRAVERTGRSPINHRGIVVSLGGLDYFVDVGYGGPMPAGALLLRHEATQEIQGDVFIPRQVDGSWWAVDRITKSKADFFDDDIPARRQTELELCMVEVEDFDFNLLNIALSQQGDIFRDNLLANLRTENGYRALVDFTFTIREDGRKTVKELMSADEQVAVLRDYFGVDYRFAETERS